jgi:hypothetical protein
MNTSNQDSQFDLHMNHALPTHCNTGWWSTNCSKSCLVYSISGHCIPGNGSSVWGCNSYNCLNDACATAIYVYSQGCKIGLEGDYCDRCEHNILFPIVLASDRTSTYDAQVHHFNKRQSLVP